MFFRRPRKTPQQRDPVDRLTALLVSRRYGDGTYAAARRRALEILDDDAEPEATLEAELVGAGDWSI